jgi:hypothetical protein
MKKKSMMMLTAMAIGTMFMIAGSVSGQVRVNEKPVAERK